MCLIANYFIQASLHPGKGTSRDVPAPGLPVKRASRAPTQSQQELVSLGPAPPLPPHIPAALTPPFGATATDFDLHHQERPGLGNSNRPPLLSSLI